MKITFRHRTTQLHYTELIDLLFADTIDDVSMIKIEIIKFLLVSAV